MLTGARMALWGGRRSPLPPGARWVEYLFNDGLTQYINTGIVPTTNTEVSLTFDIVEHPASAKIFGGTDISNNLNAAYVILRHDSSQAADVYNFRVNHNDAINVSLPIGTHTVTMNKYGTRSLIVDGNNAGTFTGTLSVNLPIYLFCRNSNGAAQTQYSMPIKLRALQIRDANGVLVRDFIPVRKGTVGYLYDRVSGQLFGNDGTGDFVVGPDVVPVEYLGFNNSQYINTGLTVKSSLHILLDAQVDDICRVFGGRTASGSNQFDLFQYSTTNIRPSYGNRSVNVTGVGTGRHTFDFNQNIFSVDGIVKQTFTAQTFSAPSPIYIGALSIDNSGTVSTSKLIGRLYSTDIYDGDPVRKFSPVRVGSGSTWEGAMMDTLTRRIYRNAGTGAFTYGNDLPLETLAN